MPTNKILSQTYGENCGRVKQTHCPCDYTFTWVQLVSQLKLLSKLVIEKTRRPVWPILLQATCSSLQYNLHSIVKKVLGAVCFCYQTLVSGYQNFSITEIRQQQKEVFEF